ncbi:hypothetical protein ACWIDS_15855 [Dietzia maris]
MAAMTPGRKLVRRLRADLAEGLEFSAAEEATLAKIEAAEDRLHTLRGVLETVLADGSRSSRRVVELAGEVRQTEAAVEKMVASIGLEEETVGKSVRHQRAARARWSREGR